MKQLNITNHKPSDLVPYSGNARNHTKKQIKQIANSIDEFGFLVPILIDKNNGVICGHGRSLAAEHLKMETIPCIQVEHLTEEQKRAYILADNKLTELGGWDQELLAKELIFLQEADLDFSLEITGFEIPEVNMIIEEYCGEEVNPELDEVPELSEIDRCSEVGALYQLGKHRVLCASSLDLVSYERLFKNEKAQMILTDPPYNVPIDGHVSGKGTHKHREFSMAAGEMTEAEFISFLKTVFERSIEYSHDGSIHYVFMDWRHMKEILSAGSVYSELKNLCVWAKDNAGMGSFYRSQHELCFIFKAGDKKHINNFELGQYGRYRTNVWQYAGANSFASRHGEEENPLSMHPTVKPVEMLADAIQDCSYRGDIIFDPFLGSGSTLIAAEQTERRCFGVELDPLYVDVIIARWEKMTGKKAKKIDEKEGGVDNG